jgi:Right handed beta helix region
VRLCGVVLCLLMALFPAGARADIFTVTLDTDTAGDCTATPATCNLREAITAANGHAGLDEIHFNVGGAPPLIEIGGVPPVVTDPVLVDGTTQVPPLELLIDLEGLQFGAGSAGSTVRGFVIDGEAQNGVHVLPAGGPVTITDNVIGLDPAGGGVGFHDAAIVLEGTGSTVGGNVLAWAPGDATTAGVRVTGMGNAITGNTIGLARDGVTPWDPARASPGVLVACGANGTQVTGNLIGGADVAVDAGAGACAGTSGLTVSANRIGTTASNHAGVSLHGALPGAVVSGNTIRGSTVGAGVTVGGAAAGVTIRGNAIDGNAGLGIDLPGAGVTPNDLGDGDGLQNFPAIEAPTSAVAVALTLSSKPNRAYVLEIFASPACDASGFGEGATPLGTATVTTDASGAGRVPAAVAAQPAGTVLTATATDVVTRDTSEFSACPTVAPPPLPPPTLTPTPQPRGGPPPPVLGKSVDVTPVNGPVRIRRPRAPRFVPLRKGENIPVGSTVDATRGRVRLTAATVRGKLQTAVFFAGQFKVTQARSGLTELVLNGPLACPKGASAATKKPKRRDLWGDGKGTFRTRGRYGSAAIRGTRWLTSDRCDGTHFAVRSGVVQVTDFTRHRRLPLRAGKRYLAPARR